MFHHRPDGFAFAFIDGPFLKQAARATSNLAYENKYSVGSVSRCGWNLVCVIRASGLVGGRGGWWAGPLCAGLCTGAALLPAASRGVLSAAPGVPAGGVCAPVPHLGPV